MKTSKKQVGSRSTRAQGIVEAVGGLVFIGFLGAGLMMLVLNVGQFLLYQQRIDDIADKAIVAAKCELVWNNAMRPRASMAVAESVARSAANTLLRAYGLPEASNLHLSIDRDDTLTLEFDVRGMTMPSGGVRFLPSVVSEHARANFIIPRESPPCYLTITIDNNRSRSIVVPAYGPHGGDAMTNATMTLQQRLNQGTSGYARLLPNRVDGYGICQFDHSSESTTYSFSKHR